MPIEARRIDDPRPGFWLVRLARGAPLVPAAIMRIHTRFEPGEPSNRMERSPFLAAFINGELVDLDRVWLTRGQPITEAEYRFRVADTEWAKQYAPDEPIANPRQRVEIDRLPLPF